MLSNAKISKFFCVDLEKFMLKCGERYQVKSNGTREAANLLHCYYFYHY